MPHPFLSDSWIEQVRIIRDEYGGKIPPIPTAVRMNLVITDVPFSEENIDAHLDTSSGGLDLDLGHIDNEDLVVTVGYDVAKAILVEGNSQAGMQAFITGKVRVDGDITKLMALLSTPLDASGADELATRLIEITE